MRNFSAEGAAIRATSAKKTSATTGNVKNFTYICTQNNSNMKPV
jgi:hypothetical protein